MKKVIIYISEYIALVRCIASTFSIADFFFVIAFPPGKPILTTNSTGDEIYVMWTSINGSFLISNFTLQYKTDGDLNWVSVSQLYFYALYIFVNCCKIFLGPVFSFIISELKVDTQYYIRIQGTDAKGNKGEWSLEEIASTSPCMLLTSPLFSYLWM